MQNVITYSGIGVALVYFIYAWSAMKNYTEPKEPLLEQDLFSVRIAVTGILDTIVLKKSHEKNDIIAIYDAINEAFTARC